MLCTHQHGYHMRGLGVGLGSFLMEGPGDLALHRCDNSSA